MVRAGEVTMTTIAITGASGFVGKALSKHLTERGMRVRPMVRPGREAPDAIRWNPASGSIEGAALSDVDVLIHLAGESIAAGRWTERQKRELTESRVRGTTLLSETLAGLQKRPRLFISASAVGYYGDRGEELLDERSTPGTDFLAELAVKWEQSTHAASDAGVRVVHARLGIVFDPSGGALAKMLTPFKLGLGGVIGSGRQFMSWIALEDVVRAFEHVMQDATLRGPANFTAPEPVPNRELTQSLSRALHRPALLPVPAFAARLAFGEMADAALLSGARAIPAKLLQTGFQFTYPTLRNYLEHTFR